MIAIHLDESNGATETVAEAISSPIGFGNVDQTGLLAASWPIAIGKFAYEKWLRYHVTTLGEAGAVQGFKLWADSAPFGTVLRFNGAKEQGTYDSVKQLSFIQPATSNARAPFDVPTSEPISPNIGIGGNLSGQLTAPGRSDYCILQAGALATLTEEDESFTGRLLFSYEVIA